MAKLSKQCVFLLLVGLLALSEADPRIGHDSDDKGKGLFGFGQKHDDDDNNNNNINSEKLKGLITFGVKKSEDVSVQSSTDADENNCKCGDNQVKEFFDKFIILFRAYGSKELAPEIKSIALKIIDFVMGYLAKEKPEEMGKIHNFLQSSVKVTSDAVIKNSNVRDKRNFGSFK